MNRIRKLIVAVAALAWLNACVVVKEYEKVNINDPDMALVDKEVARFQTNFQAYREAAAGNGGKTGGGCGCN